LHIDFLGLQAFVSIAEYGSFQRAAAHLNLSQTALSHRMKKLEDYLGIKLMVRTTRQLTLTPAGQALLAKARPMLGEMATSLDALRQQGMARQERLAIGCLPTIAAHHLPPLFRQFKAEYPDIFVKVYDNSAAEIGQLVQSGEAEFGITIVSVNQWDLETRPLLEEPFVLAVPQGHALARQGFVNWQDLGGTPLVRISSQAGNRRLIDDALAGRVETLMWRYEVQHLASAVAIVRAGVAMAVVPRLAIDMIDTPGLVTLPLRNPRISRTLGILSRRGHAFSKPGRALLNLIVRHMKHDHQAGAPAGTPAGPPSAPPAGRAGPRRAAVR
jgi:DNA-binding transcriptional LysR family regulator